MRDIRVATVQFQHAPGDKAYNLEFGSASDGIAAVASYSSSSAAST